MQQCGICLRIYDESDYPCCPYCEGLIFIDDDDDDEDDDEYENYELSDEEKRCYELMQNPGVFAEDGDYVRCPICNGGLRFIDGVPTCPFCKAKE